MREMLDDGRRNERTAAAEGDENGAAAGATPTGRFARAADLAASRRTPASLGALASTRSDWLLHGRSRTDVARTERVAQPGPSTGPVVVPEPEGEAVTTRDLPDEAFIADTVEAPDLDDASAAAPVADRPGARAPEEFLTVDELADELRYVERPPRTLRAALLDR